MSTVGDDGATHRNDTECTEWWEHAVYTEGRPLWCLFLESCRKRHFATDPSLPSRPPVCPVITGVPLVSDPAERVDCHPCGNTKNKRQGPQPLLTGLQVTRKIEVAWKGGVRAPPAPQRDRSASTSQPDASAAVRAPDLAALVLDATAGPPPHRHPSPFPHGGRGQDPIRARDVTEDWLDEMAGNRAAEPLLVAFWLEFDARITGTRVVKKREHHDTDVGTQLRSRFPRCSSAPYPSPRATPRAARPPARALLPIAAVHLWMLIGACNPIGAPAATS